MQAPMLIVPGVLSPQSDVNIYYLFLRVEYVSTDRQTHCNTAGNCCKYVGLHYNNTNNTNLIHTHNLTITTLQLGEDWCSCSREGQ